MLQAFAVALKANYSRTCARAPRLALVIFLLLLVLVLSILPSSTPLIFSPPTSPLLPPLPLFSILPPLPPLPLQTFSCDQIFDGLSRGSRGGPGVQDAPRLQLQLLADKRHTLGDNCGGATRSRPLQQYGSWCVRIWCSLCR